MDTDRVPTFDAGNLIPPSHAFPLINRWMRKLVMVALRLKSRMNRWPCIQMGAQVGHWSMKRERNPRFSWQSGREPRTATLPLTQKHDGKTIHLRTPRVGTSGPGKVNSGYLGKNESSCGSHAWMTLWSNSWFSKEIFYGWKASFDWTNESHNSRSREIGKSGKKG